MQVDISNTVLDLVILVGELYKLVGHRRSDEEG